MFNTNINVLVFLGGFSNSNNVDGTLQNCVLHTSNLCNSHLVYHTASKYLRLKLKLE